MAVHRVFFGMIRILRIITHVIITLVITMFAVEVTRSCGKIVDFTVSLVVIVLTLVSTSITNNMTFFDENESLQVSITAVDATRAFLATVALLVAESLCTYSSDADNLGQVLRLPWLMITATCFVTHETRTLYRIARSLLSSKSVPTTALMIAATTVYVEQIMFWIQNLRKLISLRPESQLLSSWWTNKDRPKISKYVD